MTIKRILFISDTQIPYDDRRALKTLIRAIGEIQPEEVVHVGDVVDFPQPSRWNKNTAGEFEGSVFADVEQTKRRLMEPLRAVYDGPVGFHSGNHDERPRDYLVKYSPALAESGAFNIETLLDFDGFGVTLLPEFYKVAPGWISTHGHRGGMSLSRIAGSTALNAAKKFGVSVVCGHTHRGAVASYTSGYGGNMTTVTGLEVGNLMNMKLAGYLKGATANWQQGFGMLHVDGQIVRPEFVPIRNARFTVEGVTFDAST